MKRLVIILASLICLAPVAWSEEEGARLAAARELVEAVGYRGPVEKMVGEALIGGLDDASVRKLAEAFPDAVIQQHVDEFVAAFRRNHKAAATEFFLHELAGIYAKRFTVEELKSLHEIFTSPIGVRWLQESVGITKEIGETLGKVKKFEITEEDTRAFAFSAADEITAKYGVSENGEKSGER